MLLFLATAPGLSAMCLPPAACASSHRVEAISRPASQSGRPTILATGGTFRNQYFEFAYPPRWHVLFNGEDPDNRGFLLC
jgi:hypothetical protein